MTIFYAGIGSRITPTDVCDKFTLMASRLETMGYILRSGGADGSDKAFEQGVIDPQKKIIYRPCHATPEAVELASGYHPAWHRCNEYVRSLHGRNAMIVLGEDLALPAQFVICWTKSGGLQGGTAMGMSIAYDNKIPVFNIRDESQWEALDNFLACLKV